jgi:excisionase family DNA binding protein
MADALVYTAAELAVVLGVSETTVYRLARRSEIPSRHLGRRIVFPKAVIDRWLERAA